MGFLRYFVPVVFAFALAVAPGLQAQAEGKKTVERAPASTPHKTKKKSTAGKGKAAKGKKNSKHAKNKKAKKSKAKHASHKAKKKKHSSSHPASALHAPVDGSGQHMPVPGDLLHEQKADLPPPNNGTLTE